MVNICFINWYTNNFKSDFFYKFVQKYIDSRVKINFTKPDIIFFSFYGKESNLLKYLNLHQSSLKIFFTGESTIHKIYQKYNHYFLEQADISLGFKELKHDKYIRFPLWAIYVNLDTNLGRFGLNLKELQTKVNFKNKTKFCCILNNHDNYNTRTLIFNKLNLYKKVDSAGKWEKNVSYKIENFNENAKKNWLKEYKFNICCESLIESGYITEKLFESLIAGCIPIYIVKDLNQKIESNIINQDFILKFTEQSIDQILTKIKLLDNDEKEFNNFIEQPILTPKAYDVINQMYVDLKDKIISKLNN